ncbi:hypothetical protein FOZ63_016266, partial [Perkinsus olseni]
PLSPTPQKDGMTIHYFNLHDLDARYHDVWDPSMYGNKRATKNECKKYMKAIGNEQFRRHHAKLDDEWKNITITKPARDKPLLVRTFSRKDVSADGDVNKALFAIAHEALDRYYAGTSNEVVALETSRRGFLHRQAVHMNAEDGGKLDGMSSQSVLNMEGGCIASLPAIDRKALKEAQKAVLQRKQGQGNKHEGLIHLAETLNRMNPDRATQMG